MFDPSDYNVPRTQRVANLTASVGSNASSASSSTSHVTASQQNQYQQQQQKLQAMSAITNDHKQQRPSSQIARQPQTTATNATSSLPSSHDASPSETPSMVSQAPSSSSSMDSSVAQSNNQVCFICNKYEAKRGSYTNRNKLIHCVVCLKKGKTFFNFFQPFFLLFILRKLQIHRL